MSALHQLRDFEGADSLPVYVLLGLEAWARRGEAAASGGVRLDPDPSLDKPALALLGVLAIHRKWRSLTGELPSLRPAEEPAAPPTINQLLR